MAARNKAAWGWSDVAAATARGRKPQSAKVGPQLEAKRLVTMEKAVKVKKAEPIAAPQRSPVEAETPPAASKGAKGKGKKAAKPLEASGLEDIKRESGDRTAAEALRQLAQMAADQNLSFDEALARAVDLYSIQLNGNPVL